MFRMKSFSWYERQTHSLIRHLFTLFRHLIIFLLLWRSGFRDFNDDLRCQSPMKTGRWSHEPESSLTHPIWMPYDCVLHDYKPLDIQTCLNFQSLRFRGDSTVRQMFWAVAHRLNSTEAKITEGRAEKHADITFDSGGNKIIYYWDPYLNRSDVLQSTNILGSGLWYLRYLTDADDRWHQWESVILNATQGLDSHAVSFVLPLANPIYGRLDFAKHSKITEHDVSTMNSKLQKMEVNTPIEVAWAFDSITTGRGVLFDESGIHIKPWVASLQANILLNRICNPTLNLQGYTLQSTCCMKINVTSLQQFFVLFMLGFWLAQAVRQVWITLRTLSARTSYEVQPATKLNTVVEATATFISALLYCFIADRTSVFTKTTKVLDVPVFLTLLGCFLLLGLFTVRRTSCNESKPADNFLSRSQTEEWKGWMQCTILLYHYFSMSKVLWVYQIVRVLVGAYLFLTCYGHTLYFLNMHDLSLRRITAVFLRLNLLTWGLSLTMDNRWDFYYFPVLASFWFGITSLMFMVGLRFKHSSKRVLIRWTLLFISTTVLAGTVTRFTSSFQIDSTIVNSVHFTAAAREFSFRVCLDRYAPFAGMLLGLIRYKARQDQLSLFRHKVSKSIITIMGVMLIASYFCLIQRFPNKYDYNKWHPIISIFPIIAYIAIRNSCKTLRTYHSSVFAWLGRCSLETFVLQYHMWLGVDSKDLLHLGLLDTLDPVNHSAVMSLGSWKYWLEKVIITAIFLWFSHTVANATSVLTVAITGKK